MNNIEIGKEYWFNTDSISNVNDIKDTCKGKLINIYTDKNNNLLYSFVDVEIYELEDATTLEYSYYGRGTQKSVFINDIFNTAEEAFAQALTEYQNDINYIRDSIKTLKDLLRFPLTYRFVSDYRTIDIYKEKVKEITGIDIDSEE